MTNSAPLRPRLVPLSEGKRAVQDETMEEPGFPLEAGFLHDRIATDCDRKRPERIEKRSVYAPLRILDTDDRPLYFVRNPYLDIIKIGVAKNVEQRVLALECGCGVPLELLRVVARGAQFEPHIHEALRDSRLFGEWFRPTPELLELIAKPDTILEYLAYVEDARRIRRRS